MANNQNAKKPKYEKKNAYIKVFSALDNFETYVIEKGAESIVLKKLIKEKRKFIADAIVTYEEAVKKEQTITGKLTLTTKNVSHSCIVVYIDIYISIYTTIHEWLTFLVVRVNFPVIICSFLTASS
jgi:hypothetical protein